jgi:hypothetical protein
MCELTIAEYNEMFGEDLPEDHHEQLKDLFLIINEDEQDK